MLNTALSTSQLRVLGTAILEWDMFSLDSIPEQRGLKKRETDGNRWKQSEAE